MDFLIPILVLVVSIGGIFLNVHIKHKRGGWVGGLPITHIEGIPNIDKGINIMLMLYPDKIVFDKKQILPLKRVISTDIIDKKQINEEQRSTLARSGFGFLIGGLAGAMVGGLSSTKTDKVQKDIKVFSLKYNNIDNEEKEALFILEGVFHRPALDDVSKYINNKIGYESQVQGVYEI